MITWPSHDNLSKARKSCGSGKRARVWSQFEGGFWPAIIQSDKVYITVLDDGFKRP